MSDLRVLPPNHRRHTDEAIAPYTRTLETIEDLRDKGLSNADSAQRFFDDEAMAITRSSTLLVRRHRTAEALVVAEKMRARVLTDVVMKRSESEPSVLSPEELKRQQELDRRLEEVNRAALADNSSERTRW